MRKKLIGFIVITVLLFTLIGCGPNDGYRTRDTGSSTVTEEINRV
ncbi:hypothetical protein [Liberiplasma polymorphum]